MSRFLMAHHHIRLYSIQLVHQL